MYLDQGLSLERIGALLGRHPSTVGYWVKKHRLVAAGTAKHAPKGGISRTELELLVKKGLSIREISSRTNLSPSGVRHWLRRFGLATARSRRKRESGTPVSATGSCGLCAAVTG